MTSHMESEIKARIFDLDKARQLIKDLGLRLKDNCFEEDHYYNHPCRDFMITDEAVRLRTRRCQSGEAYYVLTYKGPRVRTDIPVKSRKEIEIYLDEDNWRYLPELLSVLGFKRVSSFTKNREIYENGSLRVSIDHLHGVGWFVEFEAKEPGALRILEEIVELITRLRIGELIGKTYLEICLETGSCKTTSI